MNHHILQGDTLTVIYTIPWGSCQGVNLLSWESCPWVNTLSYPGLCSSLFDQASLKYKPTYFLGPCQYNLVSSCCSLKISVLSFLIRSCPSPAVLTYSELLIWLLGQEWQTQKGPSVALSVTALCCVLTQEGITSSCWAERHLCKFWEHREVWWARTFRYRHLTVLVTCVPGLPNRPASWAFSQS